MMQYQIFVQNPTAQHFIASVMGMPGCIAEGLTKEEAVMNARVALQHQLDQGEFVTIDLLPNSEHPIDPWIKHMGLFKDDPTFDDFLTEIAEYRQAIDKDV